MENLADFECSCSLPKWLYCLLDKPFSQFASILIDCWLWYCQQEFEPEVRAAAITLRVKELSISHLHFYSIALYANLGGKR